MTIYGCGVDPSGGGADQFAWAIGHWDGDRIIMDLVEGMGGGRTRLDVKVAVARCAERCRPYRIARVLGDRYAGDWPASEFRAVGILYEPSPKDKAALYLETLPLWTAGRIEIPDDRTLVRQLKNLERAGAGRGRDRVEHPRGGHDDLANAVALAVAALGGAPDWASITANIMEDARHAAHGADPRLAEVNRQIKLEDAVHRISHSADEWLRRHDY